MFEYHLIRRFTGNINYAKKRCLYLWFIYFLVLIYSSIHKNWFWLFYSCELQTSVSHCLLDSFNCICCRNWILKTPQNEFITFVSNLLLLLYGVFQWMAPKYIHSFKPKGGNQPYCLACLLPSHTKRLITSLSYTSPVSIHVFSYWGALPWRHNLIFPELFLYLRHWSPWF